MMLNLVGFHFTIYFLFKLFILLATQLIGLCEKMCGRWSEFQLALFSVRARTRIWTTARLFGRYKHEWHSLSESTRDRNNILCFGLPTHTSTYIRHKTTAQSHTTAKQRAAATFLARKYYIYRCGRIKLETHCSS